MKSKKLKNLLVDFIFLFFQKIKSLILLKKEKIKLKIKAIKSKNLFSICVFLIIFYNFLAFLIYIYKIL